MRHSTMDLLQKLVAKIRDSRSGCLAFIFCLFLLNGCLKIDPLRKHKFLTSFFDGVPDLPPVEELCKDNIEDLFNKYYEERVTAADRGDSGEDPNKKSKAGSSHRPWAEKNCTGCHNFQTESKLLLPKNEICYLCHKNFIQGRNVHGPVAVGACLACHDPHSTGNPSLLRLSLESICFKCHKEKRLAAGMHDKIVSRGMLCVDCHDPHSGNIRYFLK